jgi:RNA polymerase sigma-70 factor (ECF subfamily)
MLNELGMTDPDAALVDALRAQDASAFEKLVRQHGGRLLHVAQAITKNREDAEDVVQDSLVSVFKHLDSFRGDSRFATWLTRITINQALSIKRGKTPTFVSFDETIDGEERFKIRGIKAAGHTPEQLCSQREFANMLRRLTISVRKSSREALTLQLEQELSEAEIAETLSFSLAAVKSRLHRGKADLRRAITRRLLSGNFSPAMLPAAAGRAAD